MDDKTNYISEKKPVLYLYVTLFIITAHVEMLGHLMGNCDFIGSDSTLYPKWSIYSSSNHVVLLEGSLDSFAIPTLVHIFPLV